MYVQFKSKQLSSFSVNIQLRNGHFDKIAKFFVAVQNNNTKSGIVSLCTCIVYFFGQSRRLQKDKIRFNSIFNLNITNLLAQTIFYRLNELLFRKLYFYFSKIIENLLVTVLISEIGRMNVKMFPKNSIFSQSCFSVCI